MCKIVSESLRVIWVSSFVSPFRIAFYDKAESYWVVIESLTDLIFLLDIIFSFISAYYNRMDVPVHSRKEIACAYLKSWFFIDIITIIPL